jgi:hypothetical protein
MWIKPEKFIAITKEGKLGKIRKNQKCYHSGRTIEKGEWCEISKVMPNSSTGNFLDLEKPKTYYFCHTCGECTH